MERKTLFYMGLMVVAALWGTNYGISRLVMETFDPSLFAFLRFGLAVPILFVLLRWKEGSVGIPVKDALQLMLLGLFGVTALENMVMYAIKYTTLANASLLNVAPWPIFAALFGPLFTREKVTSRLVGGGAVAMVGVCFVILAGGEGLDLSSKHMLGNVLALATSIIGALFNLGCMPLMKRYSPLRITTWTLAFGALFMLPLTWGTWGEVDWAGLGVSDYSALFYNVIGCTVVAIFVWNFCMFHVGATRSNFFRYVVPAAAMVAGYALFEESIALWQMVGALCMAAGLVWISMEKGENPPDLIVKRKDRFGWQKN